MPIKSITNNLIIVDTSPNVVLGQWVEITRNNRVRFRRYGIVISILESSTTILVFSLYNLIGNENYERLEIKLESLVTFKLDRGSPRIFANNYLGDLVTSSRLIGFVLEDLKGFYINVNCFHPHILEKLTRDLQKQNLTKHIEMFNFNFVNKQLVEDFLRVVGEKRFLHILLLLSLLIKRGEVKLSLMVFLWFSNMQHPDSEIDAPEADISRYLLGKDLLLEEAIKRFSAD